MRVLNYILFLLVLLGVIILGCDVNQSSEYVRVDSSDAMNAFRDDIEENSQLTREILEATPDRELEDKIISNIYSKQNPSLSNDKDVLPLLSKERQAIYYIFIVEQEIADGGFAQLYQETECKYMFDKIPDAFEIIKASKFADITKRANQVFYANEKELSARPDIFDKLDQEFHKAYDTESLADLKINFIRGNIEAFVDK